jgi:hypothetical protein
MTPGYSLEESDIPFREITRWIDGIPNYHRSLFGGKSLAVPKAPLRFMLGFCCIGCGFIELYAVTEEAIQQLAKPQ